MSPVEAVLLLQREGLYVELNANRTISVAADRDEPPDQLKGHGVTAVYGFGFWLEPSSGAWLLHVGPPDQTERFELLEQAVARGLELYRCHRQSS
jgi:hypothetical protein